MGFREMYKRMLEKMTFYMIFHKITRNLIWFQMKILRKMISVENPCGKNVPKFQVHICCRYEVINHRECAFLPFSNIYSCFASGQKLCCDKRMEQRNHCVTVNAPVWLYTWWYQVHICFDCSWILMSSSDILFVIDR